MRYGITKWGVLKNTGILLGTLSTTAWRQTAVSSWRLYAVSLECLSDHKYQEVEGLIATRLKLCVSQDHIPLHIMRAPDNDWLKQSYGVDARIEFRVVGALACAQEGQAQ
jgi:hypothetical protein